MNRICDKEQARCLCYRGPKLHLVMTFFIGLSLAGITGCDRNPLSGSKLTLSNYNQITPGMSKAQVERILGPPTKVESKDMILFHKTTYRYEDGKNFAIITFKNDEVESKDTNLGTT
jgi:outer membrane protein assembly factor BamE (lipoprotein component of BamABCDE complex)